MISFRTNPPAEYVRAVFTHPEVWNGVCDDGCDDPAGFDAIDSPLVDYLVPVMDGQDIGCLMLVRQNHVVLELHTALLPEFRGAFTKAVFDALLAHIREAKPEIRWLRTWVPAFNRAALVAAKRVGFREVGVEPSAYLKAGSHCDLHLFGVSL